MFFFSPKPVFRIPIHWFRIRIQHFRLDTDPDTKHCPKLWIMPKKHRFWLKEKNVQIIFWRNTVLSSCCFLFSQTDLQKVPFSSTFYSAKNLFAILFDQLLAVDQLSAVRQSGEAFSELEESTPTFPPTFKVDSKGIFLRCIQCCGSMTFWCGSGSGSADPCLWLMDPDPYPDPAIFIIDLEDANKKIIF